MGAAMAAFTIPALAQETKKETKKDTTAIIWRQIKLNDDPREIHTSSSYSIAGVEVVQHLWDSTHLGYIQVGMANRRAAAVPDKTISNYLQDFTQKAFGQSFKEGGIKMLWVIEAIRIGEKTGAWSEKAYFRFKGTSYGTKDGVNYVQLGVTDIVNASGGMDVTHKHKSNIVNALQDLMNRSSGALDAAFTNPTSMHTREEIIKGYQEKRNIPALTETMNEGLYATFADFVANKPTMLEFDTKAEKRKITVVDNNGNPVKCWGIVKKGEVYKVLENRLVPLEKYQNGYIISTFVQDAQRRNAGIFWSAMAAPGAAFIVEGTTRLLTADAYPNLNPSPEATAIDMETGAFIF
ncbi:hypothetical protein CLV59_102171 [Chitinophaga dinghuensis]|uniref:Uncharacterized protein n=2 Tax=Chitinophaga dinghuensis TaxID=1539050 RepID=A0A327W7N0_9BACT|nr:hypothetical protein CLV59_102171 [Chitinophaga dinghuensis]